MSREKRIPGPDHEEPFEAVGAIAGRVAFYPEHVEITSEAVSN